MKNKLVITFLALISILPGCRSQKEIVANGLESPVATARTEINLEGSPVIHTFSNDGISFSLVLAKSTYDPGEIIEVTAQIDNQGDTSLVYWMPSLDGPPIAIVVEADFMHPRELYEPVSVPKTTHDMETTAILEENHSITRQVVWDQTITPGVQAPPGEYQISAIFRTLEGDDETETPITLKASFRIEGSAPLISQIDVLTTVLDDPIFREWYTAIGSVLICDLWEGENVALINGKIEVVTDEIWALMSQEKPRICNVHLEEGPNWRVTYANKYGPLEGSYWMLFDATNGKLLSKFQHTNS